MLLRRSLAPSAVSKVETKSAEGERELGLLSSGHCWNLNPSFRFKKVQFVFAMSKWTP